MNEISELDLQNLRHLIGGYETSHCKMTAYAESATDMEVKSFFQQSAQSAYQTKQQLMQFLQQKGYLNMMMNEKAMVVDALTGINGELTRYAEMITQTENPQLKQTLKQIRNQCETSQEDLYKIARNKSYYVPAAKATAEEIQHVKSLFTQP